jgi:beta-glucosidase
MTDSLFAAAAARVATGASCHTEAAALVGAMTRDEKLGCLDGDLPFWPGLLDMVAGGYYRHTFPAAVVPRLGVPGIQFADGPRGCVVGAATAFPVCMARGATFDADLEERIGEAIGAELRARGATFTGAVCMNLLHHPAWGRAQETYGEDPLHVGTMAVALTRGLQRHVIACMKHFALNSMENARFTVDVTADERAMHEVYLPHFRMVAHAGVGSVMSAYNSVNGRWCAENGELLTDVLRNEWGWDGFVISDFIFGVRDAVASMKAGLDIEMPFQMRRAMQLGHSLDNGELDEGWVDAAVQRIVATLLRFDWQRALPATHERVESAEHLQLAHEAAVRSTVLLRNEPVGVGGSPLLPLSPDGVRRVAVLGRLASVRNLGDGGSSDVHPTHVSTVLDGLREAFGERVVHSDHDASLAADSDVAIVVVGLTKDDEGEYVDAAGTAQLGAALFPDTDHPQLGVAAPMHLPPTFESPSDPTAPTADGEVDGVMAPGGDRRSLRLSADDEQLITSVVARQPRTIVVLMGGSALVMPWAPMIPAVLQVWYPGVAGGQALADIITGAQEPGGRLPFAVPAAETDLPPFDPQARAARYGLLHGQWFLDEQQRSAAFPFGHGVGYTRFELSDAAVAGRIATVTVSNVGERTGSTVVFAFAGLPGSVWTRPRRRLIGFQRVTLEPASTGTVQIDLDWSMLAVRQNGEFIDEAGEYVVDLAQRAHDPGALVVNVVRGSCQA